jgi:hypothetical protein
LAPSLNVLVFRTTIHRDVSDVLLNGTNLKRKGFGVVKAKKDGWLNQRSFGILWAKNASQMTRSELGIR